jgi:gas vesicle protein
MAEDRYSTGSIVLAFVAGGLVGAGIALLTAPQSGRETREQIKDLAEDAKEKIKSVAEDARLKVSDALRHGKDIVGEKKHIVTTAFEAGKKAMEEEKHRLAGG